MRIPIILIWLVILSISAIVFESILLFIYWIINHDLVNIKRTIKITSIIALVLLGINFIFNYKFITSKDDDRRTWED